MKLNGITSLDEIPERARGLFALDKDGTLTLDEARLRTDTDVENVKKAKDMEVSSHNATKAELAKFREICKDSEELRAKIADLESKAVPQEKQSERLAEVVKENNALKLSLSKAEDELKSLKPEYDKLQSFNTQYRTNEALDKFVKTLKGVDAERLTRALKKDISLGYIMLDESGEGLVLKDRSDMAKYAMQQATDFGFLIENVPGKSSTPSARHVQGNPAQKQQAFVDSTSFLDDDIISKLDS